VRSSDVRHRGSHRFFELIALCVTTLESPDRRTREEYATHGLQVRRALPREGGGKEGGPGAAEEAGRGPPRSNSRGPGSMPGSDGVCFAAGASGFVVNQ
jgi:hypothetical protein